jgi:hypothetical protein
LARDGRDRWSVRFGGDDGAWVRPELRGAAAAARRRAYTWVPSGSVSGGDLPPWWRSCQPAARPSVSHLSVRCCLWSEISVVVCLGCGSSPLTTDTVRGRFRPCSVGDRSVARRYDLCMLGLGFWAMPQEYGPSRTSIQTIDVTAGPQRTQLDHHSLTRGSHLPSSYHGK